MVPSKLLFPIRAVSSFDDMCVISQLPSDIQAELGRLEDSGYADWDGSRDLFFQGGHARYKLGSDVIVVYMNESVNR